MTPEQIKELREMVGKAVGCDGPYRWGIEDYVAVAEHFYVQGQKDREQEIVEWLKDHDTLSDVAYGKKYGEKLLDYAMEHPTYAVLSEWLGAAPASGHPTKPGPQ